MNIEVDKYNSEIFGILMGNVSYQDNENLADFEELNRESRNRMIKHLTIRVSTKDKKFLNLALKDGYEIADTLVQFVFLFDKANLTKIEHKCILRDCCDEDISGLKLIARTSFAIDRFHSDEHLDNDLCDKYYEQWIENSYHGFAEKVIVAEYNNEPVGFTTGKTYVEDEFGHLVLSAVSSKYRGIGVYTSMIYEGVKWMQKEHGNLKGLIVGTQIDNIAVQKAWINLGFTVMDSYYVLQKYMED